MISGKAMCMLGSGDVQVNGGFDESGVGLLAMHGLPDVHQVGERLNAEQYGELMLSDCEIVMTFDNVESLDVVIKCLQRIRVLMESMKKEEGHVAYDN